MFENVVVGIGTDDEAGDDAIALARQLVSARGELALVHVLVGTDRPAPDSGSAQAAVKYRHVVEELTDLARQVGIAAEVSCIEARSVRRGLHEFASARHADLLVVGASRSDEVMRMLLGDETLEVLDGAPCPVAVAPSGYAARVDTLRRIGVAYDGSTGSERALTLAKSLASDRGAEVSAFEAVRAPLYPRDIWDVRRELDHPVEEVREQVAASSGVQAEVEVGDPADELARYAHSVDLLVIGPHKHRPIDHMVQETTSQQLAERPSSPLLVLSSIGARGDDAMDAG